MMAVWARVKIKVVVGAAAAVVGAGAALGMARISGWGLLLTAGPALVGVWLLAWGCRGRRVGEEPRCSKCGYILLHLASYHCPECGTEISAGNTVTGEHRRGWGRVIAGILFLTMASLVMTPPAMRAVAAISWYQYKPAGFVLDDLDSPGTYLKAITELQRRESAGGLPQRTRRKLVEKALKEQAPATATPRRELLDYLGGVLLAGRLTDQEKERFLDQTCMVTMTVRPVVAEGDPVPVGVSHKRFGPEGGTYPIGFWISYWSRNMRIDGKVAQSGSTGGSGRLSGESTSWTTLPAGNIGKHTIEADNDWKVWYGTHHDEARSQLLGERSCTTRIPYEVVPREKAPKIGLLDSEELRTLVLAAVKIGRVSRGKDGYLNIHFQFTSAPCDLAFDVFVLTDKGEMKAESITCAKGKSTSYGTGCTFKEVPARVNVLLRGSVHVAKQTVDLGEIYSGEILFRDVAVAEGPY